MRAIAWLGLLGLAGCGDKDVEEVPIDRDEAILSLTGDPTIGQPLYDATCTFCHGANGEGGIGNKVAPASDPTVASDEVFVATVLDGRTSEGMAAYADDYTDQEIADMLAYVRTLTGVAP